MLFVWVVYLSELVKYSLIERYLAAKIGTILVVLVLSFVLISAISIYNDDLAFPKGFLLVFVLLNYVRFCAFAVFLFT